MQKPKSQKKIVLVTLVFLCIVSLVAGVSAFSDGSRDDPANLNRRALGDPHDPIQEGLNPPATGTLSDEIRSISSNETYMFVTKWGTSGSGDGQFNTPIGVTVDSSGNVYVADTLNNRIQKFNSDGTFLLKWGTPGSGDGQFYYPAGVAVDPLGYVYVADTGSSDNPTRGNRIQKFSPDGTFIAKWGTFGTGDGQFQYPYGIAVDPLRDKEGGYAVYVADTYNNRIQLFDTDGVYIRKWGALGRLDGQFQHPYDLAADSGNVYVSDHSNDRVEKFDWGGTFLAKWGSTGSGDGQFIDPSGIALDSSGNVYVTDTFNNRIQKFNSYGTFLLKWGSVGSGDGQFYYPSGVAVDSSGNIYVSDRNNCRIQKFAPISANSPWPNFTSTPTSGTAPLTVTFTDLSTNTPTSWNWSFGDGSYSTSKNPWHIYSIAGTYTVSLTATNAAGSNKKTSVNYITVNIPAPVANFVGTPTSGSAPLTVTFTDTSTGSPTSWNWSFGDGRFGTDNNPWHIYSVAGTYSVALNVTNSFGSNIFTRTNYVTVTSPTHPSSTVGVFRNGTFYLAGSNTNGGLSITFFNYGMTGDVPVDGDWNGDGTDTVGIFRRGNFFLASSNTPGGGTVDAFNYGMTDDVPVAGRWSGTGSDTVGIFRNGKFFLASSNIPGGGTINAFNFGQAGDKPIVGDWNGDGTDTVGIFRNGLFALASHNFPGGGLPTYFTFGQAGDLPVTGDWNADGKTEVGIFRDGMVYQASGTGALQNYFYYGMTGDLPVGGYFG